MTERESLSELVEAGIAKSDFHRKVATQVANYLIANGVRLPVTCDECKNCHVETAWCSIHSCFIDRDGKFCHPWENFDWKMFDGAYYCADGERRADNEGTEHL